MRNPNLTLSTEDKEAWTKLGLELEERFLSLVAPSLCPDVRKNPAKDTNPYALDFVDNNGLADLKCQSTPFFTATRYGYDPGRTVTFNRKDYERYLAVDPELTVYFYVHWQQLSYFRDPLKKVEPLHGVWRASVSLIRELRQGGRAIEHEYQRRKADQLGNARSSFLLHLDDLYLVGLVADKPQTDS